jgi:hypothetical protein
MFAQVVVQFTDRPVGERQAHIRRPLLGQLADALQVQRTELRRSASRVRGALKSPKARLIEFSQAAVSCVLSTAHLARGGQYTHPVADQSNQFVALGHPLRQLALVQFGFQHLFLAAPEAAQL